LDAAPQPERWNCIDRHDEAQLASLGCLLPQEQLGARTAEGRRLRRRVLRGTVLVCIIAGYEGKRFIYERAKELGVRSVPST